MQKLEDTRCRVVRVKTIFLNDKPVFFNELSEGIFGEMRKVNLKECTIERYFWKGMFTVVLKFANFHPLQKGTCSLSKYGVKFIGDCNNERSIFIE